MHSCATPPPTTTHPYSNWKGIHFVSFNSETYIDGGIGAMLDFLRKDLAKVDKTATPWVVAFAHKVRRRALRTALGLQRAESSSV